MSESHTNPHDDPASDILAQRALAATEPAPMSDEFKAKLLSTVRASLQQPASALNRYRLRLVGGIAVLLLIAGVIAGAVMFWPTPSAPVVSRQPTGVSTQPTGGNGSLPTISGAIPIDPPGGWIGVYLDPPKGSSSSGPAFQVRGFVPAEWGGTVATLLHIHRKGVQYLDPTFSLGSDSRILVNADGRFDSDPADEVIVLVVGDTFIPRGEFNRTADPGFFDFDKLGVATGEGRTQMVRDGLMEMFGKFQTPPRINPGDIHVIEVKQPKK